ncbi:hypothetical protein [Brevundimonas sp.]|uniref:hypothetical protein n=1 Tax=Brevundimonas sp. TaxID=1871086 RepID=UPI003D0A38E1
MTESDNTPGRADRIAWIIAALCMAATCYLMAMNGMIDLGAAAHDAFCPDHGWAA